MFWVFSFLHQLLLFKIPHSHRHLLLPKKHWHPKSKQHMAQEGEHFTIIYIYRGFFFCLFCFWSFYSCVLCCQCLNNFSSVLAEKLSPTLSGRKCSVPLLSPNCAGIPVGYQEKKRVKIHSLLLLAQGDKDRKQVKTEPEKRGEQETHSAIRR